MDSYEDDVKRVRELAMHDVIVNAMLMYVQRHDITYQHAMLKAVILLSERNASLEKFVNDLIARRSVNFGLLQKCRRCNGKRYFMIGSDECKCPDCNGTGVEMNVSIPQQEPIRFCGECIHLDVKERDQHDVRAQKHNCLLRKKRLYHGLHHPNIVRVEGCDIPEKEKE